MEFRTVLRRTALLLFASLQSATLFAQKQDAKALALLEHARPLSTLSVAGLPPYRLEASFETFNRKGEPDGTGTVVQTGIADGRIRRITKFRGKTADDLRSGEWHHVADADFLDTFTQRHLLDALFEPVPSAAELSKRTVTAREFKAGATPLQCAVVSIPVPNDRQSDATAASNAYCFDTQTGLLRVISGHNGYNVILNGFRKLGGVNVANDITILQGGVKQGHLRIDRFVTDPTLSAADFVQPPPSSDMVSDEATVLPPLTLTGRILKKTTPIFPDDAKARHVSGTVTLNAIIGRDGTIRDLEILTAPDDSLAVAAMNAVRTWTYEPYLVNGKPTEVKTTITVNFSFGA